MSLSILIIGYKRVKEWNNSSNIKESSDNLGKGMVVTAFCRGDFNSLPYKRYSHHYQCFSEVHYFVLDIIEVAIAKLLRKCFRNM